MTRDDREMTFMGMPLILTEAAPAGRAYIVRHDWRDHLPEHIRSICKINNDGSITWRHREGEQEAPNGS